MRAGIGTRRPSRLLAVLLVGWGTVACASREQAQPTPTLRIGHVNLAESLEPNCPDYFTVEATSHIYEGFVRYDADVALRPALAHQWQTTTPETWLLHLREGVRFHDGTPFTALEAKRSIDAVLADPAASGRQWLASIEAVTVDGELTLRLETRIPEPLLLHRLARFKIARRAPSGELIGTGPYRVSTWQPGRSLELEAFEGYWGGPPAAGRVQFVRLAPEERLAAVTTGRVDIALVKAGPGATEIQSLSGPTLTRMFLWFANDWPGRGDPLGDRRVRQAIFLAMDRARLSAIANLNPGLAAWQLVPRGLVGHNPRLAIGEADIAEARRLLTEAGWAGGFTVPLLHLEGGGRAARTAAAVVPMLARIGIRAELQGGPMTEILETFAGKGHGLLLSAWTFDDADAGSFLRDCVHSRSGELGLFNPGSRTREMDDRVEAALAELDPLARQASYQELMRMALDVVPAVPLFDHAHYYALTPRWHFRPRADSMILAQEFTLAE